MNKATERVVQQFKQWRSQPKPGRVPHHLKEQALRLCAKYTDSELSSMLGVTGRSIRNWKTSQKFKGQNFISLPDIQPSSPASETYTVNLRISSKIEAIFINQPLSKIIAFTKAIEKQD